MKGIEDLVLFLEQAGLSPYEVPTLVRLAATSAQEYQRRPAGAYESALWSFGEPDDVHALALRVGAALD